MLGVRLFVPLVVFFFGPTSPFFSFSFRLFRKNGLFGPPCCLYSPSLISVHTPSSCIFLFLCWRGSAGSRRLFPLSFHPSFLLPHLRLAPTPGCFAIFFFFCLSISTYGFHSNTTPLTTFPLWSSFRRSRPLRDPSCCSRFVFCYRVSPGDPLMGPVFSCPVLRLDFLSLFLF